MSKSILIVDDNYICVEGIRKSIQWDLLNIEKIYCAYDGQTALDYLNKYSIDLIISDISMPGLSGLELLENVVALNSFIKIILISAYDKFDYAKKAVRLGAFDYIEKPLDYDYLNESLKRALSEIEQEKQNLAILKKSIPALEEQFFRSLISPFFQTSPETLDLYTNYLSLNLEYNFYTILQISTENTSSLKQKLGIEEYHVRFMNLENYIQNICHTFSFSYILKDLSGFTCILGENSTNRDSFKKKINSYFSQVANHFSERFDLAIGLGKIVNNINHISTSYVQAKKALEYRFFFPSQNILEATGITGNNGNLMLTSECQEDALIQLLCKNDKSGIHDWILEFTNSLTENCASKNLVYIRLYSILTRILKFTYEMDLGDRQLEQEITSVFAQSDNSQTINTISEWLYSVCIHVCNTLQSSITNYHQNICESAIKYIEKNYQNSDLNLNEIAEYVKITPAYLSSLFKKCRQQNISNYITDIRIDSACQLLKNNNISLKTISSQVGYSNQYYFSSCFKKKIGMTPSSYREQFTKDFENQK